MTVINKVNDDSESYFSDYARSCFVIQCCNFLYRKRLIYMSIYFRLIISANFLSALCFVKFLDVYKLKHLDSEMKHFQSFRIIFLLDYSVILRRMKLPTG